MRQLAIAILGQGRSGHDIHVRVLTAIPALRERYRIALVCDPIADRVSDAARETGCDISTDWRTILGRRDLDLVINATPSDLHVPISEQLLTSGHNVLCEKPLARHAAEVDRLVVAAQRSGQTLAIFQQSRYAPYFLQLRKVIDSGVLGRVVQIRIAFNGFARRWDWQTMQRRNAGSLLNTGPHPLDQALQLFGESAPRILCRMDRANSFGDAEDHVKLLLWDEDRASARPVIDLEVSSCCAYPSYTYQVYGTHGGLTGSMERMEWKWFDAEQAPRRELISEPMPDRSYCSEQLPWQQAAWEVPAAEKDLFMAAGSAFYTMLHRHLAEGAALEVTLAQVRRQIAVIEECHRQNPLPIAC